MKREKPHSGAMSIMRSVGTLTAAKRKRIPSSQFGLPGSRKYPLNDRSHAGNAKARAAQMVKAGKLSRSSEAKIDARANRVLGKGHHG